MRNRILLFLLCILCSGGSVFAQTSVSGKVVDASGLEIPGVNIVVKGQTVGTMTGADGTFTLTDIPGGSKAVLVFSFIGYRTQEVKVGNQKYLNIRMEEDSEQLDEVVVVAYGTQKRKDLTGSLTQIDSKVIGVQSVASATKALEGTVPGLQISAVDGQPGIDAGIRVRGIGSTNLNSSSALVVVDGVPIPNGDDNLNPLAAVNSQDIASITVLKDAASTALYGSRGANGVVLITTKKGQSGKAQVSFSGRWGVNSIGNFDYGRIDNAKDYYEYAWKSIYNSYRYGVNGSGLPQNWTTNVNNPNYSHEEAAEFASQHLFNYVNKENSFGRNMLGNFMAYDVPGMEFIQTGNSSTMAGAYLVGTDGKLNPNARLLYDETYGDYLLENNFRQEYNVSVNGGSDRMDYFVSLGYLEDPSYLANSKFSRYSGRANVNAKAFDWLKVGAQMSYSKTTTQTMALSYGRANAGSNQGNVMRFINGHAPTVPVHAYDKDGNLVTNDVTGTTNFFLADGTYSPFGPVQSNYGATDIIYSMANDYRADAKDAWTTRVYGELSFLKDFKLRASIGYDQNVLVRTRYFQSLTGRAKNTGGMSVRNVNYVNLNTQEMLSYTKSVNLHNVDAMFVHEYNHLGIDTQIWGAGYEFLPGFVGSGNFVGKYTNAAAMETPSYAKDLERMESYLARVNYDYDGKYYASASFRTDGSSKFKKNKWGTFWSVGAGWRFSDEKFMEDTKTWLDNAKVRVSYGVIGNANAIGRYSGYRTWSVGTKYSATEAGTGTPNGVWTMGMGAFVNDQLTWENTKTWDAGIDMSFLDSRLSLTFDFYNRLTDNSFYNRPVSYMATGQDALQANTAAIRNRGIELEIGANIIRTEDFSWNVSLNGTTYTTILKDVPDGSIADNKNLPSGTYEANGDGWSVAGAGNAQGGAYYLRGEGRSWYNLWLYKYAGVDQETGLPLYYHRVSADDVADGTYPGMREGESVKVKDHTLASKYEMGSAIPKWIGGFTTTFRYKDFDFTGVLAYQLGGKFYSVEYGNGLYRGSGAIDACVLVPSSELIGNTWTPENRNAKFPMQWYAGRGEYYDGATMGSWKYTDMALFSASYLRVKNLTLGYTLPKALTQKAYISSLRVYVSGDNLFLLSAAKGIDPSMSLTGGMEVNAFSYPAMRTLSLGVNVNF